MGTDRNRQKKLEKKKKKRAVVLAKRPVALPVRAGAAGLAARSARWPVTHCMLSGGWRETKQPELVTAVLVRESSAGERAVGVALVDRTCLGIKDGYVMSPPSEREFQRFLDDLTAAHGGVEDVDWITLQSVVFSAIDYARKLGFQPHPDFPEAFFGPRPDVLVDTPWASASRPIYMAGPYDDAERIVARLTRAVGSGGFGVLAPSGVFAQGLDDELDDDELDGDEPSGPP